MRAENVGSRFSYHPAKADQAPRHEKIRAVLKQAALDCAGLVPDCCERDKALDKLQEAMMLFNAAISCNE